ncbi:ABC transporter ATP-binding protein [Actinoalloteichus sp. AHMU CJ021]|uniref:ABC transporter ATP-binding protein n=1 Tax=Actinoalloteichus TaxID=65496 RepID=UPI000CA066BF|nr:ABC transporter ATP-binding protein [Actinoalloteichus sp. AHMU CJ021]WIW78588.1 CgpD [Actinoalloteichus caeruleus]
MTRHDEFRIQVDKLTKRFGSVTAVNDLSFTVEPGVVTGFLGPNGAGKTTTMRMILGLVTPTSGTATIGGRPYADLPHPSRTVGAVLDSSSFHPGHVARDHLAVYCRMGGYPLDRVDEVIHQLGIGEFADRRTRGFSTGMRQRLNLATALLGDARVLLLDEPSNGLDPEGIAWLRSFLKGLADQGRTVLVSSHVLSEVEQVVDEVVVVRRGELVASGTMAELSSAATAAVVVRSPDDERLAEALRAESVQGTRATSVERLEAGALRVEGLTTAQIADLAADHRLRVHELTPERSTLEQVFLRLTSDPRESVR